MTSIKTGPSRPGTHLLAIPAATSIIVFLGYSSQWLFHSAIYLAPGPLSTTETVVFNVLLCCLWLTYFRACMTDPGRYVFSSDSASTASGPSDTLGAAHLVPAAPASSTSSGLSEAYASPGAAAAAAALHWCKKCDAPKPPRAHHCRHCSRCVPKMDHHCPWTGNCVSMQTFPHFLRFVVFTNAALWYLAVLLGRRFYGLYDQRHLPSYLGPTLPQLLHLILLGLVSAATLLALTIMLYNTVQGWLLNTTMIESWEIDRHEAVIARYNSTSSSGSWWDEDDDDNDLSDDDAYDDENADGDGESDGNGAGYGDENKDDENEDEDAAKRSQHRRRRALALRRHVEFPYDLGFFDNMAQAMGTRNVFLWLFPLAGAPTVAPGRTGAGWDWPENGFNDHPDMWPPPDPEKMRYAAAAAARGRSWSTGAAFASSSGTDAMDRAWGTPEEEKAAFQERQAADFQRRRRLGGDRGVSDSGSRSPVGIYFDRALFEEGMDGEPGWTNADGDRLRDYGVDEEAEQDEQDMPLAQLLKKRAAEAAGGAGQKIESSVGQKGAVKKSELKIF